MATRRNGTKATTRLNNNQQAWLALAYEALRKQLLPDAPKVQDVILTYGFPKLKRGNGAHAIGQCFVGKNMPKKRKAIILVHPKQWTSALDVLHVELHEMIHAWKPEWEHGRDFALQATTLGFEGKPTHTVPGKSLVAKLKAIAKRLPKFPASGFDPGQVTHEPQGSRMRRYVCKCDPPVIARVASDEFKAHCDHCEAPFRHKENPRGAAKVAITIVVKPKGKTTNKRSKKAA
jgi:hypothetical protein